VQSLKRIVVASDFSAAAHQAVCRAGQLAKQNQARLHLIHVRPDWNLFSRLGAADYYHALTEDAERALTEELAFLKKNYGIDARGETRCGSASHALRAVLGVVTPQLIVIGAHGEHGAASAPYLGGTALKLLAFADTPVLVVRNVGDAVYSVAVLALERSEEAALRGLEWVRMLMPEGDCHIVHAYSLPYIARRRARPGDESPMPKAESIGSEAHAFVDRLVRTRSEGRQRLHPHVVYGEPVAAVLAEMSALHPDLLVIGKHEHAPREPGPLPLGSVALRIAYHAMGDVLVVPQ
jgi:nucleotide-binding universal stress UspA family protein